MSITNPISLTNYSTETVVMTPSQAAEILAEANTNNRPLREYHVNNLAREIESGRWQLNPHGLVFSPNGRLLDGQHRLAAIVKTGVTLPIAVTYGVPEEIFSTMDNVALTRSASDAISLQSGGHVKYSKYLASTLRLYRNYVAQQTNSGAKSKISNTEVAEMFSEREEWVGDVILTTSAIGTRSGLNITGVTAATILAVETNPSVDLTDWLSGLMSGANLSDGSPILALRNYANRYPRPNAENVMRQYVRAMNAWLTGAEVKVLRDRKGAGFDLIRSVPGDPARPTAALDSIRAARP